MFPLIAVLSIVTTLQAPDSEVCIQGIERPSYSQSARRYDSQGTVAVRFSVGEDGKVVSATYEANERITSDGNDLLKEEVRAALGRTQFDRDCKGDYMVLFRFVLEGGRSADPATAVEFKAPNEFVIRAKNDVATCSIYSIEKPSWRKRLVSKLKGRGKPLTVTTIECY